MAMARPVVLTPEAATGIEAEDGAHFAVADDDAALAHRALALLGDACAARAMGEAARAFVQAEQGWAAMLAPLPAILGAGEPVGRQRDAA